MLEDFHSFMIGPYKGRKPRSIEKVVGDVRRIFKLLALDDIRDFFVNDMDLLRRKYLMEYCAERKTEPSSIKKYLASVVDFTNFIIIMKIDVGVEMEEVARCKLLLETWRKVYKQKENKLKPLKREIDLKMMVTDDQIKLYEKSENCRHAEHLFNELKVNQEMPISQRDFVAFRDHILYKIHFASAHRSGVTANMAMGEYEGREVIENGMVRINVMDHKTVDTYGSAQVMLLPEEFQWLKMYVQYIRKKVKKISTNYVFISWNGNKMASGDVSGRLHTLWSRAGNFESKKVPKKLCCNAIRKTTSTLVRAVDKSKSQVVADSMLHSLRTAEEHYARRNLEIAAEEGSKTIRDLFKPTKPESPYKTWDANEESILEKTFPTLAATKSLIDENKDALSSLKASPKQIYDKLRRMRKEKEVIF